MSYYWEPVFRCELCGKERFAQRWEDVPFGLRWLPEGWSGSRRKHGSCYCEECTTAIRNIRKQRYEARDEVSE